MPKSQKLVRMQASLENLNKRERVGSHVRSNLYLGLENTMLSKAKKVMNIILIMCLEKMSSSFFLSKVEKLTTAVN